MFWRFRILRNGRGLSYEAAMEDGLGDYSGADRVDLADEVTDCHFSSNGTMPSEA